MTVAAISYLVQVFPWARIHQAGHHLPRSLSISCCDTVTCRVELELDLSFNSSILVWESFIQFI